MIFLYWDILVSLIELVGTVEAVFIIFFFSAQGWVYALYIGRLKDRQKEIDRLAGDNREYRDRFMKLMDDKFDYKKEV